MKSKGSSLIFSVILIGILSVILFSLIKITYDASHILQASKERLGATYLSYGAIEAGIEEIKTNPSWYTDLSPKTLTSQWLKEDAKGLTIPAEKGMEAKVVKFYKKEGLYGIGLTGKSCVIIKYEDGLMEEF